MMKALQAQSAEQHNNLGYTLQQQGKLDEAIAYYEKLLEIQPDCIETKVNLGNALYTQGKLSPEEQSYYAELNNQLGTSRKNAGDLKTAVAYYQQAIALQPDWAEAHYNLGDALQQQGKLDTAEQFYLQALKFNPDYAYAYHNLGSVLKQKGQLEKAVECYRQALQLEPDLALTHNNLGNTLKDMGKLEAAVESYQQALKLKPDVVSFHYNLANAFKKLNKLEAAVASYQQALSIQPDFDHAKFGILMSQIPIIYTSIAEIKLKRNRYQQELQKLADSYKVANQAEQAKAADAIGSHQSFYLAYQGLNDRDLQQTYGEMITQIMSSRYPQWCQPLDLPKLEANEKIRIGFVSGFFCHHSNWKIPIKGWVENLDRTEFELFGYHTGSKRDQDTVAAAKVFDKFTPGPLLFEQWCELIQQDKLDILIFPEFGMNPTTIKLGCLRLAPVQMTSWGHPNTSGLPTIDYYLSSDLMEPENGQEYYTEKLVRLPNLSIHYTPLGIQPKAISKRDIGIQESDIMFWCCQSLFKYLPNHDDVFPRIAKELGNSKFVFIKDASEYVTDVFRQRLSSAFQELGLNYQDHCIFLSPMNPSTFAGTAAIADVFLDSIGWSGCNSTLEAIAHNIPVLTLPGDSMRGRHTLAILKMMGIENTIASNKEEYVKIAIRLGQEPQYRQNISRQIAETKHNLYGDLKPIRALEDFLLKIVNKPRRPGAAEVSELLQLAVQYQRANRITEAEQLYCQILDQQPNHPEALYGFGMLMQQSGKIQEAEQYLSTALQLQPDSVKTWFSLGNLRQAQGQLAEAEEAYQRAIALRPDAVPIYNNLGYTLHQQGKFNEAVACYQKALELQPNCTEAEANLGNALHAQGKLSREQKSYYGELNHKLGMARQKAGDWETALAYYRQALELNPNFSEVYFNLGKIYQQQKNFQEAIAAYRQGLILSNPHYAAAVAAYQSADTTQEAPVTPPISQAEVTVGAYQFPTIPPVADSDKPRPFWSVVITVYNRADYLLECLASVLAQWNGAEEMEILVMDDASTSPLFELVNGIGAGIVRYYRNPHNFGLPGNWNAGIALTCGQWVHLLHDDDYILPGFYARLKQSLESCPDSVGAACTGYENINEQEKVVFSQQLYGDRQGIAHNFLLRMGIANLLNMPAVVIRRQTHEKLGLYHPELTYTSDWEIYKRIAAFYDWWYEPGIGARYRQHSQSKTNEMMLSGTQVSSIRHAIEISESYLPTDVCKEITQKSRSYYFHLCLQNAAIPLKTNNIAAAWQMLKETLKIDQSPEAVAKLFAWLNTDEAVSLRDEIASRLMALPLNNFDSRGDLYDS